MAAWMSIRPWPDPPPAWTMDSGLRQGAPALFGLVYRILGVSRSRGSIQESGRDGSRDRGVVRDPQAFLGEYGAHLAINVLQPHVCAAKRTSGHGFPNRSIQARIPGWGGACEDWSSVLVSRTALAPERAAYVAAQAFTYPY